MTINNKLATLFAGVAITASSASYGFQFANESLQGSFDSTIAVGFGRRANSQDCNRVGDTNTSCGAGANTSQFSFGDNGNLNYNKGDFFSAYVKGTHDLLLNLPEGYKFMTRMTWLYDAKADKTRRSELMAGAHDQVAKDVRLLDFWVSKNFTLNGQSARVRLGNQVQNWGESIFAIGGISVTNALDIQKLQVPGTLLKEAVIPAPMISFSTGLGHGFNFDSYYQFAWNRNRLPPVGSYFSLVDFFGKGRDSLYIGTLNPNFGGADAASVAGSRNKGAFRQAQSDLLSGVYLGSSPFSLGIPVAEDITPKNSGQYGLSMHYKPAGSSTDFGFYYVKYHDKLPVLSILPTGGYGFGQAQWQFLENRELYGVSTNFALGNWAIGSELSYRPRDAISLSGCFGPGGALDGITNPIAGPVRCNQWIDNKKYQFHLTGLLQLTPGDHGPVLNTLGADTAFLMAEAVFIRYPGVSPNKRYVRTVDGIQVMQAPAAGYGSWMDKSTIATLGYPIVDGQGTENSWGFTVDFNWTYDGTVIPGWQLTPGVTYFNAVKGDTPSLAANFLEGAKSANFYVLFNQNPTKWQAGMNYTKYFGGDSLRQPLGDRSFFGGFLSYSF